MTKFIMRPNTDPNLSNFTPLASKNIPQKPAYKYSIRRDKIVVTITINQAAWLNF
ncbi:hypothetical protein [Campylobacter sp. RM15925]|uniref:hypothetical protein n=1 Tax=Campylobacter sp. RM15925 TaxID=1705724 RepID=UPI00147349CA|nr:hypothetical protein [Campylobacter sp. RM15925]